MRVLSGLLLAAAALGGEIARDTVLEGDRRLEQPLRVVADGVTLDLTGAVLRGSEAGTDPDEYRGIGLIVEGRKNVTIRGGRLWGFRCAVLVKGCENVVLEGLDVSGNFRQHLRSTPEREYSGDWLWPHENDAQQWRQNYGAGICLEDCRKCVVRECVGRKQQNGLILDRCTETKVEDNDFSFNSGWGIAMWRSSRNTVHQNSCDWCVRGYSHGVYARGQDSAGILVFEQCHENSFTWNSATHGGDGFFLYAGNETLKRTGQGGCNFNIVYGNDFSHAVANAIEATFSRGNSFRENRCNDSNYGIWAGYSYDNLIYGNQIGFNSVAGIAIEHGARIIIQRNRFERNGRGIWLWWDNDEDLLKSKFGQAHPCLSKTYLIVGNEFRGDKVGLYLRRTSDYALRSNAFHAVGNQVDVDEASAAGEAKGLQPQPRLRTCPGPGRFLPGNHPRGRKHILVGEWGPLDPNEYAVFPRHVVGWGACAFHVLGPDPHYEVEGLPEGLVVEKKERTFRVRGGAEGVTEFGCRVRVGGKTFPLTGLLLNAQWRIRHWAWTQDPRQHPGAWKQGRPLADLESDRLDYTWATGAPADGVPADRFATRAETTLRLPAGRYEIRTVSDDGVRVLVDGETVQEDWTWHAPKENKSTVELGGGEHRIVVEHFEIDGYAVLRFDLRPLGALGAVAATYRGKYEDDPRLARILEVLPARKEAAVGKLEQMLGVEVPDVEIRLEDAGRDPSGAWAEARTKGQRQVLVLKTEYLVLGAYDLDRTLVHELFHCLHRERLGIKAYARLPEWVREGAALYVAGQGEERARILAAFVGRDPRISDPLARLVDGLGGQHGFLDYYEDVAAFEAADARHGRDGARRLIRQLLETSDVARAVRAALDESLADFEQAAAARARGVLAPLVAKGRASILAAHRHLEADESAKALEVLEAFEEQGVYAPAAAYYRAVALFKVGRPADALRHLRTRFLDRHRAATTLLDRALRLEVELLEATGSGELATAKARAALDLTVYP